MRKVLGNERGQGFLGTTLNLVRIWFGFGFGFGFGFLDLHEDKLCPAFGMLNAILSNATL